MSWHFDVTESNCKNGQIWSSWSYWQWLVDSRGVLRPPLFVFASLPFYISCLYDYFYSWQMIYGLKSDFCHYFYTKSLKSMFLKYVRLCFDVNKFRRRFNARKWPIFSMLLRSWKTATWKYLVNSLNAKWKICISPGQWCHFPWHFLKLCSIIFVCKVILLCKASYMYKFNMNSQICCWICTLRIPLGTVQFPLDNKGYLASFFCSSSHSTNSVKALKDYRSVLTNFQHSFAAHICQCFDAVG